MVNSPSLTEFACFKRQHFSMRIMYPHTSFICMSECHTLSMVCSKSCFKKTFGLVKINNSIDSLDMSDSMLKTWGDDASVSPIFKAHLPSCNLKILRSDKIDKDTSQQSLTFFFFEFDNCNGFNQHIYEFISGQIIKKNFLIINKFCFHMHTILRGLYMTNMYPIIIHEK